MRLKHMLIARALETALALQRLKVMTAARGRGIIFTLHQVRAYDTPAPDPNRHLEISPRFLDSALRALWRDGYRFVRLEDVPALLSTPSDGRPFAAFTLDDGYRNSQTVALPVFERFDAPVTLFVCKGFTERTHTMWWETLAELLRKVERLEFPLGGRLQTIPTVTPAQKERAFRQIARDLSSRREAEAITALNTLALAHGLDAAKALDRAMMTAEELKTFAGHPLVSLGAHGVSHRGLTFLDDASLTQELADSAAYVEGLTGKRPESFAYPYGDGRSVDARTARLVAEAGFKLAVTTRPGTLQESHGSSLLELPRVSLNGHFQNPAYVSALASGIPFALARPMLSGA
ncbi:polysaccharide deacetylase family protein [Rhizobium paknamense]|uniref:Chitooligosaccharide deacetylase n=1 Tax=Rhizobium paknamense TaxID=1206817 RepID=A0ABU0IBQ7_9HYPH|nr:polysaccharide deacetylase family protein [Rhizobium paknamense]MDQ0455078.1 peptidoglycan/xylan/chitin deacetylase (PgdA/CDA1 family) [Rhizobium paknamense]